MKHIVKTTTVALLTLCASLSANEDCTILQLSELKPSTIGKIMRKNHVVAVKAGDSLPVKLFMEGELFAYEAPSLGRLTAKEPFYIKHDGAGEFLFSSDLINWADMSEFTTGEIFASAHFDDDRQLLFELGADLSIRE